MSIATSEFTIRTYLHGIAVFGPIPLGDCADLMEMYSKKRRLKFIDSGIAVAIGATMVLVSKKSGDLWRAEIDKSSDWLHGTDTGVSSKTIYQVLSGKFFSPTHDVPHDPEDFGRCHRLLLKNPEWIPRMGEVAAAFPAWIPFVREWAKMTEIYERDLASGRSAELYDLMHSFAAEVETR